MALSQVLADMTDVLGPVPPQQVQAVDAIEEIYSCNRMMLAALPPELLKVSASGWSVHTSYCSYGRSRACISQQTVEISTFVSSTTLSLPPRVTFFAGSGLRLQL